MSYPIAWFRLEKYADLTGDTAEAVMARRRAGKWVDGTQCRMVDGQLWVNLPAVEAWIEGRPFARTAVEKSADEATPPAPAERPVIPLSIDLWDMATVAQFLKRDPQVVRERMACLPSFPKAIRLPTKTGRAKPLFAAEEVIAWAKQFKDKN